MPQQIGHIEAIFRYPVKSMRGEPLAAARLGWHGIEGDRRFAVRRIKEPGGFPWLSASGLPELLLFTPERRDATAPAELPTHVLTPDGAELAILGPELAAEIARRYGSPVEMMRLDRGVFDDASLSVIALETIDAIGREAGPGADVRRYRPNVVLRLVRPAPFAEDAWVGGVLSFGDRDDAPAIAVTARDVRCSMVNLDPDSAASAPEVLRTVVRANDNNAGVYGTVTHTGRLEVGQAVFFHGTSPPGRTPGGSAQNQ